VAWSPNVVSVQSRVLAVALAAPAYVKPVFPPFVTCTTRCAVSPGTRFAMLMRSPAFGLSFEMRSVAVWKVLSGFVVVAVNVAVVEPAVDVMPIQDQGRERHRREKEVRSAHLGSPFLFPARSAGLRCWEELSRRADVPGWDQRGERLYPMWDYDLFASCRFTRRNYSLAR